MKLMQFRIRETKGEGEDRKVGGGRAQREPSSEFQETGAIIRRIRREI